MSTIEKLFVQIFDRKRQIIDQLNHKKQLYDQHLASKLLIQGITPPPWLFHSTASSLHPNGLNKEELISELLLPCPHPPPTYSNAAHLHGPPLSTVAKIGLQNDLFNATSARSRISEVSRPGVSPQCLSVAPGDIHYHVAESPQERDILDINADPVESMARMQRSKSRQKALQLRSSKKTTVNSLGKDNPSVFSRPSRLKKGSERVSGGILSISKDEYLGEKQDISSKEDGGSRCLTNVADSSTNTLSPHSDCQVLSVEEPLAAADSVSSKEGISRLLFKEPAVGINGSSNKKCSDSEMFSVELMENQSLPYSKEIAGPLEGVSDTFELCRVQEGKGPSEVGITHDPSNEITDQVVNLCTQDISNKEEKYSRCLTNEASAFKNSLSLRSSCKKIPFEESPVVPADSLSGKEGISRHLFKEPVSEIDGYGSKSCAYSIPLTEDSMENPSSCCKEEIAGPAEVATNSLEVYRVQEGECQTELVTDVGLSNETCGQLLNLCTEEPNCQLEIEEHGQEVNLCAQEHSCQLQVEKPSSVCSDKLKLVIGSTGTNNMREGERCSAEVASTPLLSPVAVVSMSPEEHISNFVSEKPAEISYSGEGELGANSSDKFQLVEVDNFTPDNHTCHLLVEQPASDPSETMILATSVSGKMTSFATSLDSDSPGQITELRVAKPEFVHALLSVSSRKTEDLSPQEDSPYPAQGPKCEEKVRGESPAQGPLVDNLLLIDGGQELQSSTTNLIHKCYLDHYNGVLPGENCREFQEGCKASTNECSTEVRTSSLRNLPEDVDEFSVDKGKSVSVEQKLKPDDGESQIVALQTTCSKEVNVFVPTKSFELQTLWTESSPTFVAGGSWPRLKKRKVESNSSKSASPNLQVNAKKTSFHGVHFDQPCACDISATEITQYDHSSSSTLTEHCSTMLHLEEKFHSLASSCAKPESMRLSCLSSFSQQLIATSQDSLHKSDSSRGDSNYSFSSSRVDHDPADNKDLDSLGNIPSEYMDAIERKASVIDPESLTFKGKCDDSKSTGTLEGMIAIDLPKSTIDRAIFIERLCRSTSLGVPLSYVQASYSADRKGDICHSVPIGVLEHPYKINSSVVNELDGQACTKHVENREFQGNSFHNHSPIPGSRFVWDLMGPYVSHMSKEIEGLSVKSRSSSMLGSSNPELTCFRIEESDEEDVNAEDRYNCCPEESSEQHLESAVSQAYKEEIRSPRQPLCAISKNVAAQVVQPALKRDRESSTRARRTSARINKISQGSQAESHQSACLKKRKKNQDVSLDTAGVKKLYQSRSTRFSKPTVSAKSGLDTRGGSFSEKETKAKNIVSNQFSFVQLVQQKQAATRPPVKKDRVKALEAAEAAKQRAEELENERKKKKEVQKLEQAKRKQENLRLLELKKKEDEDKRKRKDAEMANRKRLREENERKEKEKKQKRAEEAHRHKKGHEDKLSEDKDECRSQAEDVRKEEVNTVREETAAGGQKVKEVARKSANNPASSSVLSNPCGDPYIKENASVNAAECSTPTPDVNYSSTTQTVCDKSYDISPYCCSDEEDEEELPNDKFIPAWASNRSVTKAIASLGTLDPDVIFPPSSFCSLNEVLLPRQLKNK